MKNVFVLLPIILLSGCFGLFKPVPQSIDEYKSLSESHRHIRKTSDIIDYSFGLSITNLQARWNECYVADYADSTKVDNTSVEVSGRIAYTVEVNKLSDTQYQFVRQWNPEDKVLPLPPEGGHYISILEVTYDDANSTKLEFYEFNLDEESNAALNIQWAKGENEKCVAASSL